MDNNMQPFAPQPSSRPDQESQPAQPSGSTIDPQLPPAMEPQQNQNNFQQGTTGSLDNQGGPTIHNTGVPLESPILAPTHFDGIKDPNIQGQAGTNPAMVASATKQPMDNEKLFKMLSIIFGALAFVGIVLGIWSLVSNMGTSKKLAAAQADLNNKNAIIAKIEADTGASITSPDNVPAYAAITDTIYIPEWGISFKIPEDLENVSYTVDQKYRPQICFTGHKTGIKYFPAFADIDQNTATLGCVTRVATYEGDSDKDSGMSFGQPIYSYGDYNYFYNAPTTHFSQDASEQGLEDTAVQIIKNMVSGNISHYE